MMQVDVVATSSDLALTQCSFVGDELARLPSRMPVVSTTNQKLQFIQETFRQFFVVALEKVFLEVWV
uniref:Uncharacterized protein n=1 Tax=Meloidogyne incognita TaxID=6306 RepID=A0A914L0F8_MELIC